MFAADQSLKLGRDVIIRTFGINMRPDIHTSFGIDKQPISANDLPSCEQTTLGDSHALIGAGNGRPSKFAHWNSQCIASVCIIHACAKGIAVVQLASHIRSTRLYIGARMLATKK